MKPGKAAVKSGQASRQANSLPDYTVYTLSPVQKSLCILFSGVLFAMIGYLFLSSMDIVVAVRCWSFSDATLFSSAFAATAQVGSKHSIQAGFIFALVFPFGGKVGGERLS